MIEDAKSYILTSVCIYIDEMLSHLDNIGASPLLKPVSDHLLSATFLQMIGAIEQKIYNINWYLGFNDPSMRYDIQKDFSRQSTGILPLTTAYNKMQKKLSTNNGATVTSLWDDMRVLMQSYNDVISIFSNSNIIEYTNSEFFEFKDENPILYFSRWERAFCRLSKNHTSKTKQRIQRNINNFDLYFKDISTKINNKISDGDFKIGGGDKSGRISSCVKVFYERMMQHRHSIAHNFLSTRRDIPLISEIQSHMHRYDSYYYRFMICIYVDKKLQIAFTELMRLNSKHLF